MPATRSLRTLAAAVCLIVACLTAVAGCAALPPHNFLDARGPRFAGSYRPAALPAAAEPAFLVASFNVKLAAEPDNALETLRAGGLDAADLLLLQEMDLPATIHIAAALGLDYVYYPATVHPASGRPFGVAILSPWPIRNDYKILLPDFTDSRDPAAKVAAAAVVWIHGIPVGVVNVHLQLGLSPEQTRAQMRAVTECAFSEGCDNPGAPLPAALPYALLAGDLNTSNDGKMRAADAVLAAADLHRVPGIGRTFKYLFLGLGKLDHIYASPRLTVEEAGQVRGFFATGSDHYPVWARLRMEGERPVPWAGFEAASPPSSRGGPAPPAAGR